jgi:hypothetical protein
MLEEFQKKLLELKAIPTLVGLLDSVEIIEDEALQFFAQCLQNGMSSVCIIEIILEILLLPSWIPPRRLDEIAFYHINIC